VRIAPGAIGLGVALLLTPGAAKAQVVVHLTGFGAAATNAEVEDTRQSRGLGFGVGAEVERAPFRMEAHYLHAALKADFSIQPDYNVDELDLTATWLWRPYLAPQLGVARRFISPEFAAQDVGLLRVGALSEVRLARIAGLWVRGAFLPLTRFSGGGSGGLGLEIGLGLEVGDPASRLSGFASFDYQRINREAAAEAPLQYSAGQAGVKLRL
jgi:hypothetical protein